MTIQRYNLASRNSFNAATICCDDAKTSESVLHFCKFLANPNIDLELDCIFGKPMKRRLQGYIERTEILSTFNVRVEYISVRKYAIEINERFRGDKPPKPPLPLRHLDSHQTHECLSRPHSPSQTASVSNQPFCHSTLSGLTDRHTFRQMV